MTAGSAFLAVADATGFEIGNKVIVELGGEAGQGMRGTVGVGGIWSGTDVASNSNNYYGTGTAPKSLNATISGKVGNVLELNASAVEPTTNATVWFDNLPIWEALTPYRSMSNKQVQFPSGRFAFSGPLLYPENVNGVLQGRNTIFHTPKGSRAVYIWGNSSNRATIRDITFQGNYLLNGYGRDAAWTHGVTGVLLEVCSDCRIHKIVGIDGPQKTVGLNLCNSTRVYKCRSYRTDHIASYIQWHFQTADGFDNHFYDCRHDSDYLDKAFETFRSKGDKFVNCGGRNALFAMNSSGGWLVDNFESTIEANSLASNQTQVSRFDPVMNINSNIQPPSGAVVLGGVIRDARIVQQGYVNAGNDTLKSINVNEFNPNIRIEGTAYDRAVIQAPDHATGNELNGAFIGSTGENTIVRGVRVIGAGNPGSANIKLSATGGVVEDCVADAIDAPTETNNMTNAEYSP